MLRVNTTAGWRGAEQGRTVGIQTNTLSHSSKSASPHSRSRRTVSYHSGQFGPPYPDSSPGKNLSWHTETNRQTKNSSAVRGGHSRLPHRAQCNTARLNLLCIRI